MPKTANQLSTLPHARDSRLKWKSWTDQLHTELLPILLSDTTESGIIFTEQIRQASIPKKGKRAYKKEGMLHYLILGHYRGDLQAEFVLNQGFFGWVGFEVRRGNIRTEILAFFDGVEKSMDDFFRDDAELVPSTGKWKRPSPWSIGSKWVSKQRGPAVLYVAVTSPVVNSPSSLAPVQV